MRAQRIVRPARKRVKDSKFEALLRRAERFQRRRRWLDLANTALAQKSKAPVTKTGVTARGIPGSDRSDHATTQTGASLPRLEQT